MKPRAVVLLSGGLDSATCLWWARARGYAVTGLSVRYGQRHARELSSARALARAARVPLHEVGLRLPWLKTSSLVDARKALPDLPLSAIGRGGVPSTYVPGRNTMFVALGLSLADSIGAEAVVVGANALDYSGYPDCRPEFYAAFGKVARLGTRRGDSGRPLLVLAPLVRLDKAAIVRLAARLKTPLGLTWSCYAGGRRPCGRCDSCKLRAKGFAQAGRPDPAL
ncbi:MAG: 7-cyano-7-deazaguanine synthase QueC [Elusimicrobia bacterium]|nr:7-cyano-7-deazaguanine synthase QueC [Elusimicrobiota bacterium]